jgi:hypothetical protein
VKPGKALAVRKPAARRARIVKPVAEINFRLASLDELVEEYTKRLNSIAPPETRLSAPPPPPMGGCDSGAPKKPHDTMTSVNQLNDVACDLRSRLSVLMGKVAGPSPEESSASPVPCGVNEKLLSIYATLIESHAIISRLSAYLVADC